MQVQQPRLRASRRLAGGECQPVQKVYTALDTNFFSIMHRRECTSGHQWQTGSYFENLKLQKGAFGNGEIPSKLCVTLSPHA